MLFDTVSITNILMLTVSPALIVMFPLFSHSNIKSNEVPVGVDSSYVGLLMDLIAQST
jgi:hypothetical protein